MERPRPVPCPTSFVLKNGSNAWRRTSSVIPLPVSLTALYDKINRTEPALVRAMVRDGAQRLAGVLAALPAGARGGGGGYTVRIVDGNHLPATEKRLKALRGLRGAALPGHTLVVYDPQLGLAVDIVPCEDAHTQERALTEALLTMAAPGQLWVADRNFSTTRLFEGFADQGAAPEVIDYLKKRARIDWDGLRGVVSAYV